MRQNTRADDPLIDLGNQWEALRRGIDAQDDDEVIHRLTAQLGDIEQQMVPLVATTCQGLAAQILILRDLLPQDYAPLVDNMIIGLRALLP